MVSVMFGVCGVCVCVRVVCVMYVCGVCVVCVVCVVYVVVWWGCGVQASGQLFVHVRTHAVRALPFICRGILTLPGCTTKKSEPKVWLRDCEKVARAQPPYIFYNEIIWPGL
jgi:hypothetical protein